MFIDSYCHLDRLNLSLHDNNLDNVIQTAKAAKVDKILCVSVTLADFPKMAEKTAHYDNVLLTCAANPLNQEDEIITEQLQK
ncbi:MAG: TatD family hydrolase [Colwellia sp.]